MSYNDKFPVISLRVDNIVKKKLTTEAGNKKEPLNEVCRSVLEDYAKLGLTKGTTGKMQTFCNKFLGLDKLGLQLPYQTDGSETAADSLIA